MKILLAIKSAWRHKDRREACRKTWLQNLDRDVFDYTFICGRHDWTPPREGKPFVSRFDSMYGETDVSVYDVPDEFKQIGPKVHAIVSDSLRRLYDYVVILDDDTYVRPERIPGLILESRGCDIIAFFRHDPPNHWPQGAFYIIGPRAMSALSHSEELKRVGPDDVLAGRALMGLNGYHSNKIVPGPCPNASAIGPQGLNDIVSVHKCLPDMMKKTHDAWVMSYV